MMKTHILAVAVLTTLPVAGTAQALMPLERLDRIEDRIDRRESRIDRAVDLGPRDVIEDRIDAVESRRDRLGIDGPSRIDRHERRSWRRLWGQNNQ